MINRKLDFKLKPERIIKHINKFVPFDIKEILQLGDPVIFGGAVRDSIADIKVYDVDIVALTKTAQIIDGFLTQNGYTQVRCIKDCNKESSQGKLRGQCDVCHDIYQIKWFNVITYKPTAQNKLKLKFIADEERRHPVSIQLIRPSLGQFFMTENAVSFGFQRVREVEFLKNLQQQQLHEVKDFILSNVDISSCGVALDNHLNLKEIVPNAFNDCIQHKFRVNPAAEFFNFKRSRARVQKLLDRNWKLYDSQAYLGKLRQYPTSKPIEVEVGW
jgi:hypothetical protein